MGYDSLSEFLTIRDLTKSYVIDNKKINVLGRINLIVPQHDFLCFVGPSGCGKSTLLSILAGFQKPDSGQILLKGEEAVKPQTNRIMVFQDFNQLFPWKTLLENILFPLQISQMGKTKESRQEMARKYLSLVKLDDFYNYYPHQLSGGMKQRAAMARALAINPEIILMDEPFGSIDALSRAELQNMLVKIWQDTGITVIFVTHDIAEAVLLSKNIVVMGRYPHNIKAIIKNDLTRPRDPIDRGFTELYYEILQMLKE